MRFVLDVARVMWSRLTGRTVAETRSDPPFSGHFEVLPVEDGDIVVFSTAEVLTAEQVARLQLQMRKQLDQRRLFAAAPIVIDRGLRIVILRPGEPST